MPELTSRERELLRRGVARFDDPRERRRSRPARSARTRAASAGSKERTVAAAAAARCVSTSAADRLGRSAGTSPLRTRTSPSKSPSASRAQRTASPVPRGSSCTATSTPRRARASTARRRRRADPRRLRAPRRRPSRPSAGRAADGGASASRSSCACRSLRPSQLLRARFAMSVKRLGRQDSNLGSRDQNPLPYHLATPQGGR